MKYGIYDLEDRCMAWKMQIHLDDLVLRNE